MYFNDQKGTQNIPANIFRKHDIKDSKHENQSNNRHKDLDPPIFHSGVKLRVHSGNKNILYILLYSEWVHLLLKDYNLNLPTQTNRINMIFLKKRLQYK